MMRTADLAAGIAALGEDDDARLRAIITSQYAFVWRCLRHLGVASADADDAAQQVFIVVSRKLEDVEDGRERAFAFATAMRMASRFRRAVGRRREVEDSDAILERMADTAKDGSDRAPARQLLEQVLEAMPDDTRAVFMLFEVEELTMGEIAEALGIPPGTVASRLRRAREHFREEVRRMEARARHRGTTP
jgi:RNA polymerase sigma-70 factor (ECF subfamily)